MDAWHREIVELHDFFEAYFLGTLPADDVHRLDVLADDFTFVGPDGSRSTREQTVGAITAGHAHTESLRITVTDAELLVDGGDTVVARYVENHELSSGSNHRVSTVVFSRDDAAPNGLSWRTVHETWLEGTRE